MSAQIKIIEKTADATVNAEWEAEMEALRNPVAP
jgi:hypothetical protein